MHGYPLSFNRLKAPVGALVLAAALGCAGSAHAATQNVNFTTLTGSSTLGTFAASSLSGSIGPGTYRLVATGTGVRDSSMDISVTFAAPVPEPAQWALMLAGLGGIGLFVRRRA